MELYKKLREYRQSKGIKQAFIARKIGISVKKLNAIEMGRQGLEVGLFEKICREGFEIDPGIFFTDKFLEIKKNQIA